MEKERIAIPVNGSRLSSHFGHSEYFDVFDLEDKKIVKSEKLTPPPHAPGVIPKWLSEIKATTVITGGVGQSAINFFNQFGINVRTGAPEVKTSEIMELYLDGKLGSSGETCTHDHEHNCSH